MTNEKAVSEIPVSGSLKLFGEPLVKSSHTMAEYIGHIDLKSFFTKIRAEHYPDGVVCDLEEVVGTHVKAAVEKFVSETGECAFLSPVYMIDWRKKKK